MTSKPEQLIERGYRLHKVLHHDELVSFVQDIFRNPNLVTRLFIWLNILLIAWLLGWTLYEMIVLDKTLGAALGQIGIGVLLMLLVIPLHEWLHGITYKCLGAKKVHYTANFKKFYFTAQAHHFVVGERGFYWLAFVPFVVITLLVVLLMVILPGQHLLLLISFLFMHTTACGGDFALAAFFYARKNTGLITFDDVPAKMTYFYALSENEEE